MLTALFRSISSRIYSQRFLTLVCVTLDVLGRYNSINFTTTTTTATTRTIEDTTTVLSATAHFLINVVSLSRGSHCDHTIMSRIGLIAHLRYRHTEID
ncbi:hypothetical protein SprV_0200705400 [Sparganum proliferum]